MPTRLDLVVRPSPYPPRRDPNLQPDMPTLRHELESTLPDLVKISLRRKQLMPGRIPRVFLLIDKLLDENKSFLMGTSNIRDEMERLMDSESSQRRLISATVAKRLSEVVAIEEIQSYLDQHQPQLHFPQAAQQLSQRIPVYQLDGQ